MIEVRPLRQLSRRDDESHYARKTRRLPQCIGSKFRLTFRAGAGGSVRLSEWSLLRHGCRDTIDRPFKVALAAQTDHLIRHLALVEQQQRRD
jgi:hypothetical protein